MNEWVRYLDAFKQLFCLIFLWIKFSVLIDWFQSHRNVNWQIKKKGTLLLQYDSFSLAWILCTQTSSGERRKEKRKTRKSRGLCTGSLVKGHLIFRLGSVFGLCGQTFRHPTMRHNKAFQPLNLGFHSC